MRTFTLSKFSQLSPVADLNKDGFGEIYMLISNRVLRVFNHNENLLV